jgi:hypothetical protein
MSLDYAQVQRSLDLWASLWQPRERDAFEHALARVILGAASADLKRAALAACHVIATPSLLSLAARAVAEGHFTVDEAADIAADVDHEARLWQHAARFTHDREGTAFLLRRIVREPNNPVADKLLDRVDVRDLWAVMQVADDDETRAEAARRIARRGQHQRHRLCQALGMESLDDALAVDVPLEDLSPPAIDIPLDDLSM